MHDNLPAVKAPFEIVEASTDDLDAVLALVSGSGEIPIWSVAAWAAFVAPQPEEGLRHVLLVCRTDSGAVDALLAATLLERTTELELLYVHPRARQQGRGLTLTQQWIRWATERGANEAWLEVRASNAAALALYRVAGFTEHSRRKAYYRDPVEDALAMQRTL